MHIHVDICQDVAIHSLLTVIMVQRHARRAGTAASAARLASLPPAPLPPSPDASTIAAAPTSAPLGAEAAASVSSPPLPALSPFPCGLARAGRSAVADPGDTLTGMMTSGGTAEAEA